MNNYPKAMPEVASDQTPPSNSNFDYSRGPHTEACRCTLCKARRDSASRREEHETKNEIKTALLTPEQFTAAYRAGYGKTVGRVVRRGFPLEDAEDAAQDAYLRAWERLEQLRDPARFGPWVNAIAPRQAVSNHRRIHRVEALEPGYEPKVAWDVDVRVFDLPRAMQRLSARQRQIVEAKSAGYSAGEIAAKLGLSVATVYSQYSRAVAEIRRQMNSRPPTADAA